MEQPLLPPENYFNALPLKERLDILFPGTLVSVSQRDLLTLRDVLWTVCYDDVFSKKSQGDLWALYLEVRHELKLTK